MAALNKKIKKSVLERSNGECEVSAFKTGATVRGSSPHHIIDGRLKNKLECEENVVYVSQKVHRWIHDTVEGKKFNKLMKRMYQSWLLEQGKTEEEVRELVGGKLELTHDSEDSEGYISRDLYPFWL